MDNLGKESGEGLTEEDELALKQMEALDAMLENDGKVSTFLCVNIKLICVVCLC